LNYLELCQATHRTTQIDGDNLVSVKNQTGMNQRVVEWVNRAYEDIQRHRTDWKFRQELGSISVIAGQCELSSLRDQKEYLDQTTVTAEYGTPTTRVERLQFVDYDVFYDRFQSQLRTTGKPRYITVANNWDLYIDPVPTEALTLKFWYTKTVDTLTENTDIPIIRAAHHDAIMWKAVVYYAEEEEASGIYQTATLNAKTALNRMELDLRPETVIRFQPLA